MPKSEAVTKGYKSDPDPDILFSAQGVMFNCKRCKCYAKTRTETIIQKKFWIVCILFTLFTACLFLLIAYDAAQSYKETTHWCRNCMNPIASCVPNEKHNPNRKVTFHDGRDD